MCVCVDYSCRPRDYNGSGGTDTHTENVNKKIVSSPQVKSSCITAGHTCATSAMSRKMKDWLHLAHCLCAVLSCTSLVGFYEGLKYADVTNIYLEKLRVQLVLTSCFCGAVFAKNFRNETVIGCKV